MATDDYGEALAASTAAVADAEAALTAATRERWRLIQRAREAGMSRADVAEATGLRMGSVADIEAKRVGP